MHINTLPKHALGCIEFYVKFVGLLYNFILQLRIKRASETAKKLSYILTTANQSALHCVDSDLRVELCRDCQKVWSENKHKQLKYLKSR